MVGRSARSCRSIWIRDLVERVVAGRIGVDQHARCAIPLRDIHLHPAEGASIANQNDLPLHADTEFAQSAKILDLPKVRIHNRCRDIARGCRAIEWRNDTRVILETFNRASGGCGNLLARRPGEYLSSRRVIAFHKRRDRSRHPDAVGHYLGLQARGPKVVRHILRGRIILRRAGPVRSGCEGSQVLPGQFAIRNGEEFLVDLLLSCEVPEAEDSQS